MTVAASPRFVAKVIAGPNGCRLWTGAKNDGGYGQLHHDGRTQYVHRLAYETFVGPIPDGFQIDHLCRTRLCVNPEHLEAVTQRENILRGESAQAHHARATHCIAGHPLSGDNLYVRPDGKGRNCKRCQLRRNRERSERTKVAS
jgi:hypothetical protein